MKTWEEMSNKERAEQTIRDIKRRQALREKQIEKGKKDAVDYIFDKVYKANSKNSKISFAYIDFLCYNGTRIARTQLKI